MLLQRLTSKSSLMLRALSSAASVNSRASSNLISRQHSLLTGCCCGKIHRPKMIDQDQPAVAVATKRGLATHEGPAWDYDTHGPDYWLKVFPDGCGPHQSPIDINTSATHVQYDSSLRPIQIDYDSCEPMVIFNSGHSFQVNFNLDAPAILSGGPLTERYQLVQFHGHWGASNSVHGSEHTVNGRAFPSELHFVHFNKDKYKTVKEAIKHTDGLSVVGVFLKINKGERPHPELEKLIKCLKDITYTDREMPLRVPINPRKLMPEDLGRYFTYPGSLTTPPLSQCITWLVLPDALNINSKQLTPFRRLQNPHTKHLMDHNYRPVMPVNDRVVRASFSDFNNPSLSGTIAPTN